ncbi:MAG TPA: DUF2971 domain-containing protein [Longimicrobium sp.]
MITFKYTRWTEYAFDSVLQQRIFVPKKDRLNDPAELIHPIRLSEHQFEEGVTEAWQMTQRARLLSLNIARDMKEIWAASQSIGPFQHKYSKYENIDDEFLRVLEAVYDQAEFEEALPFYALAQDEEHRYSNATRQEIATRVNAKLSAIGIFSMSTRSDCPVMWAHYAHNHTGAVLIFDTARDPFLNRCRKVQYLAARPRLTPATIVDALFMKANSWRYEREVRVVSKTGDTTHNLGEGAMVGVILGLKMNAADRKAAIDCSRTVGIEVREAFAHPAKFRICSRHI